MGCELNPQYEPHLFKPPSAGYYTTHFQILKILLRKNAGAAPGGRPNDGQPHRVVPTTNKLSLALIL